MKALGKMENTKPIKALAIGPNLVKSIYPEPFLSLMDNREKRRLGDFFGLKNFGVNLTILEPNGISALFHQHTIQDEFIYILEGNPILKTQDGEFELSAGDCMGFKAGGTPHQLINKSPNKVIYLEIGDRLPNDSAYYPDDDIAAAQNENGNWLFTHKDGTKY